MPHTHSFYTHMMTEMHRSIIHPHASVFIATFSHYEKGMRLPRNGMVEPLLSFFLPKVWRVVLIDGPHPISDSIDPIVELYSQGELKRRIVIHPLLYFPIYVLCKIPSNQRTRVSYKLRDFFITIIVALLARQSFDIFIGLESIHAFAGILLRQFGMVKRVIYYVSDYSPIRFGHTTFNAIYLWLDRLCVRYADATWDVSPAIKRARREAGIPLRNMAHVFHVPNGLFPSQISALPRAKRTYGALVYLGSLDSEFGADLAIQALQRVKGKYSGASLHIVGGGQDLARLKKLVMDMNLQQSVVFYGFVSDNAQMAHIIRSSYIGLAPYRAISGFYTWYGDAGKIRQYLASGLPVVTTHVPPLGRYVVEQGAGIMTKDTIESFSQGIIRLLSYSSLYKKLAEAALEISKDNTWEKVYTKAFSDIKALKSRASKH